MTRQCWVDGVATQEWPVADRGLRYGDGVFETMAAPKGEVVHWKRHRARLRLGCERLGINGPDDLLLERELQRLDLSEPSVVRLTVTRGSGGRGYAPPVPQTHRRLWEVLNWPDLDPEIYSSGIRVAFLHTTLARHGALAGIKHLNRLEQVMAARELQRIEADDGLLCDNTGAVVEAVSANVFARHDGVVTTPLVNECGVAGVLREVILEGGRKLGLDIREDVLRRADVLLADEIFLTSSIRGVVPVRSIESLTLTDFSAANAVRHYLDGQVPGS